MTQIKDSLPIPLLFLSILIAICPLSSNAKVLTSPNQLSSQTKYDFIIVGAGTAGSTLANRLTEDPSVSVLLVEAGVSKDGILGVQVPFLGVTLPNTIVDWNYTTTPQPGLNNRAIGYARGHVEGGSSSINLLTYNRGSDDVWNNWATLTSDAGWSWRSVQKYYLKNSRLVPPADGHDTRGQVNPAVHGNGPVEVSVAGFLTLLDSLVATASKQLGGRFKYNEDFNSGNFLGVGFMQSSIGNGERSSSATAYLDQAKTRKNLDVLLTTQVTKLVKTGSDHGVPILKKIELAQSASGPRFTVSASKEVILAAGVIGTPQILLLSGIGPANDLRSHSIPTLIDLPDVGQNLADHPLVPNYFSVNSNTTWDDVLRNPDTFGATLNQWMTERTGLFVDSPGNTLGYMRLPSNSPIFKKFADPASGPLSGHTELIFVDAFAPFGTITQPPTGNFIAVLTAVVSPTSRGNVTLATTNPFDHPLINPGLLNSEFDSFAMVQAMKDAQTVVGSSAFTSSSFVAQSFGALSTANNDDALLQYARNNGLTVHHPVGTARMSPKNAKWGVVDSTLKLKGAEGVRIVDASVFPQIPECHPQGLVYIVAERTADLIKAEHGCK